MDAQLETRLAALERSVALLLMMHSEHHNRKHGEIIADDEQVKLYALGDEINGLAQAAKDSLVS